MQKIYGITARQDGLLQIGRNRWDLFYGFGKDEDSELNYAWYTSFNREPTQEEVRQVINDQITQNAQAAITKGYKWKGHQVWLSVENQQNYIADYIMAKNGVIKKLPTIKLGSEQSQVYYTFSDIEDFSEFVAGIRQHIQDCLSSSWEERKAIDWNAFSKASKPH